MATTLATLQTRLAYRLNEDSTPTDSNEKARRTSFFNEAQRKAVGEKYWWFLQDIASTTSVAQQEIYTLESDFRDMMEVRIDSLVCLPISRPDIFNNYDYPPLGYEYETVINRWWVFGDSELHILPVPDSAPTTYSVSGIVRSGTTATVTTTSAHGYEQNDYVTIAGADQSEYNGAFRVQSAPTTTTFTITVDSGATTPATGTITATQRDIVYRYWKVPTAMSADSDTTVIPDRFADLLVAYALGRKMTGPIEDERGSSADAFEEYNQILQDMTKENNRKMYFGKQVIPRSYQETIL